jgi:proteasome lid subunit RPN8/RPN11
VIENIEVSDVLLKQFVSDAERDYPREMCGIFLGELDGNISTAKEYHYITNVSPSESKWDYVPHPDEYMKILMKTKLFNKKSNLDLSAIIHTHPHNMGIPSEYDVKGAQWKTVYLIYGMVDKVHRAWFWDGEKFTGIMVNNEQDSWYGVNIQKKFNVDWNPMKGINV